MKHPEDVISVELTVRQIAVIKALFGEMIPSNISRGIYAKTKALLPKTPLLDGDLPFSPNLAQSPYFVTKVENMLRVNGYSDTPPSKLKEVI